MSFADIYKERSLLIGFSNIVIIIIDEISFALWWCLKLYIYIAYQIILYPNII